MDEIGMGGPMIDRLKEMGFKVKGFNAGRKTGGEFLNAKALAYWSLKEQLENRSIAIPKDDELWEELLATRWTTTSTGLIQIEKKELLKARIGRSPDKADMVAMLFDRSRSVTFGPFKLV